MEEPYPPQNPGPPDDWGSRPEDLPPIQPPSAGFIVQLFIVPLVIVAVVVGVYVLFGQLAAVEQDWRQLVIDVKSENPHVKGRGALGLAQLLDTDSRMGEKSQHLDENREIATALAEMYAKLLTHSNPTQDELQQIEFLSKALGQLEVDDVTIPALRKGFASEQDRDVRKHSLIGVAMIVGRAHEQRRTVSDPALVQEIIDISREEVPLFRHQAAFILGLLDDPAARDQLEALLQAGDQMTRVNAAIGLVRANSTAGLPVFTSLFDEAKTGILDPSQVKTPEEEAAYFEQMQMLLNSVRAIEKLAGQLDAAQRKAISAQLSDIYNHSQDNVLNSELRRVITDLEAR